MAALRNTTSSAVQALLAHASVVADAHASDKSRTEDCEPSVRQRNLTRHLGRLFLVLGSSTP